MHRSQFNSEWRQQTIFLGISNMWSVLGYYDCWRYLQSWISDFWDKVAYVRASRSWQTAGATNATAMVEDGMRPKGLNKDMVKPTTYVENETI